ncbi:MAG: hypothetical protein ACK55Z_17275 [bacterium]|jgi:hypothetical protein
MGPFYPLEEEPDAPRSDEERLRYEAWLAALHQAYHHLGLGLDFSAASMESRAPSPVSGASVLATLQVLPCV